MNALSLCTRPQTIVAVFWVTVPANAALGESSSGVSQSKEHYKEELQFYKRQYFGFPKQK